MLDSHSPADLDPAVLIRTCGECGDPVVDASPYVPRGAAVCEPCRIHAADLAAAERQRAWQLAHLLAALLPALRCATCAEAGYTTPAVGFCVQCDARVCDDDHGHLVYEDDSPDGGRMLVCEGCL
jgi:hypothetical protein